MFSFRSQGGPSQRWRDLSETSFLLLPQLMISNRLREFLWKFFLAWAGIGLLAVTFRLTPAWADTLPLPNWLRGFVGICLKNGDFVSMLLAASHVYFSTVGPDRPSQSPSHRGHHSGFLRATGDRRHLERHSPSVPTSTRMRLARGWAGFSPWQFPWLGSRSWPAQI